MKISHLLPLFLVLAVAIAGVWFLVQGGSLVGAIEMSSHGWIALGLGMGVSVVLGGGLAVLLIWSRRNGFDEAAHQATLDQVEPDTSAEDKTVS
jgi:hypothetical protein